MFGWGFRSKSKREIIINSEDLETRVAVMDNGKLDEYQVEHPTEERMVGSIYKGRIQNLENDLQAAFVDIGMRKNAFLHYWDMIPDDDAALELDDEARSRMPKKRRYTNEEIRELFPPGSETVVQVTKGPIGTKGPRVTASLSIPGRYLVMIPGAKTKGISRKIVDEKERQRLKKILSRLEAPPNTGLIVRTVGSGARKGSFETDLEMLAAKWESLQKAGREQPAPSCLYQEPDLVERVIRDWVTDDVDRVLIDSPKNYERIRNVAAQLGRRVRGRIQLYDGEMPIFDHHEVERQLEESFRRHVNLKSGGCIVFDETEALVAIDVNTGRYKGKGSQEQSILEVNTEAVEEVARQLRLRNIGGLVVIDLIDMKSRKHQATVYRAMKDALKRDKAKMNVLPISELGIMEMSRQRVEESILSSMYMDCPYCKGHGLVKAPLGISVEVQRQIRAIFRRRRKQEQPVSLLAVVHPSVLERMRREDEQLLMELENEYGGRLSFKSDPSKHMEFFAIKNGATDEVLYSTSEQ